MSTRLAALHFFLYLLPYRRKLWKPVFRDNSPTCLRIRHLGPSLRTRWTPFRGKISRILGLVVYANRIPDRPELGIFFGSETLGREEIWVTFEFDFESRSHILIAEFGIEFKRWHESKIDLTIISKFSTKCINIARSSWDQVERESDELRYSLIVFWLKFFFKYIYNLISTNSKEGIMKRPFYKEGNEIRKGVSSW